MAKIKKKKIKVLLYGDSPTATTGLGRLHRYLCRALYDTGNYEFDIVGLNHHAISINSNGVFADYDHDKYPYNIVSTFMQEDIWGYEYMHELLAKKKYDLVITSHDIQRITPMFADLMNARSLNGTKWIMYTCIDRFNLLDGEADVFAAADHTVFYSDYSLNKMLEKAPQYDKKMSRIYLPVDFTEYPILTKEEREEYRSKFFGKWDSKSFIIGNINRNTFRKDLVRTMMSFKEYTKINNKAKLYLHCKQQDEGGDLGAAIAELQLSSQEMSLPMIKEVTDGFPQGAMNSIFQSLDVLISTSKGEGYGYSTVEAFATKTPVIMPNNTSLTELVGKDQSRGFLVGCDTLAVDYGYGLTLRQLTNVQDMANALDYVEKHYELAEQKAEVAYTWAKENLDINIIKEQWITLINQLLQS